MATHLRAPKVPRGRIKLRTSAGTKSVDIQKQARSVQGFLTVFENQAQVSAKNLLRSMAADIAQEVKVRLTTQSYKWVPLNPRYLAWKKSKDLDTRALVATKFYHDHLGWWQDEFGVHVGVPNITHKPSGLPLPVLARIHEFGTDTVPPRPLWRPALAAVLARRAEYLQAYQEEVRQALTKK